MNSGEVRRKRGRDAEGVTARYLDEAVVEEK